MPNISQYLKRLAQREVDHLLTIKSSDRAWHLVVTAAFTISSTILIGALFNQLSAGILSSLGTMIILNQPSTGTLAQRQKLLLLLGVIMVSSFSMGLVAHNLPDLRLLIFAGITSCIVVLGRYLHLPPPGGMFIMMASVIAIFMPVTWSDMPIKIATVAAGAVYAWMMAFLYNLFVNNKSSKPLNKGYYERGLLIESLVVTVFVVLSLEVALLLQMSYPYWVPVSCYIILQGMHLRTMWIKQLHRVLGTTVGMFVAWLLLSLSLSQVGVALAIFCMFVWIETMVVRHYALAVIMITPMTIFIAEYGRSHTVMEETGSMIYQGIIQARFLDTLLGCSIALVGGLVMHSIPLIKPFKK